MTLEAYTDADYARSLVDRRSTSELLCVSRKESCNMEE